MQTKFLTVLLGASMMLGLMACTEAPKAEEKMTNGELERLVAAKINSDPKLTAYDIKVSADVDRNEATVSGEVPSESLRTLAVDLAKTGRAGLVVNSKIEVDPAGVDLKDYTEDMGREARDRAKVAGESVGDNIEDAWLHTKIRSKLLKEGEFPGGSLNVDVKANAVTLRGSVGTAAEKAKAGEIATSIDGVKSVNNRLVIKPN